MNKASPHTHRNRLRRYVKWLSRTPMHPHWLMPNRELPRSMRECQGYVLDIGSADRWLEAELSSNSRYIALDYPTTAVNMYGTRPDVFADAHQLPFSSNSIDAITCFEVLEHVSTPDRVIMEIARVLKDGGVAALSMPFLYPVHDAPYDYQRWTSHKWKIALECSGLTIESIKPANHPLHAAAVLATLALAAPLQQKSRLELILRAPFLGILIPSINLGAWLLAFVWPQWSAMTTTIHIVARKHK